MRLNKRRKLKALKKFNECKILSYREESFINSVHKLEPLSEEELKWAQEFLDNNKELMDDLVKAGD